MKINNETKVGILAVVAIVLLVLGFNFLKGNDFFKKTTHIYAVFEKLGALDKSNVVKINGLPIGTVYEFAPTDKEGRAIIVTINLTKEVNIPRDSKAFIASSIVGSSSITIEMGNSNDFLQHGDTIQTVIDEGVLGDLTSQVTPTLTKTRVAIDSLTVLIGNFNRV